MEGKFSRREEPRGAPTAGEASTVGVEGGTGGGPRALLGRRTGAALAAAATCVAFASLFGGPGAGAQEEPMGGASYDEQETRVLTLLNDYRAENGLSPLVLSDAASVAAEKHNQDLAKYGYTGHETGESDHYPEGSRSWDRMAEEGYPEDGSHGENLAYGQDTPEDAMQSWKESEGHNENMLDERWKVVGISHIEDADAEYDNYWATDFGSEVDGTAHEDTAPAPPGDGTTPESTTPESTSPESTTPEEAPEGAPESTTPESTMPESTGPESTGPESTGPESTTPESTTPSGSPLAAPPGDPEGAQPPEGDETPEGDDNRDAPPRGGNDDCDLNLGEFLDAANPLDDEDFNEKLNAKIKDKLSCEMGDDPRQEGEDERGGPSEGPEGTSPENTTPESTSPDGGSPDDEEQGERPEETSPDGGDPQESKASSPKGSLGDDSP